MIPTVDQLREQVLQKRPVLRELLLKRGTKSLAEYAHEYVEVNVNDPIKFRQEELIGVMEQMITERLNAVVAKDIAAQLRQYYFVSTADHHGPVCSPSFLNSNLIVGLNTLPYIVVLSCANVSLGNHTFPRGLLFTSDTTGQTMIQRLAFLPSNAHSAAVHNFRSYLPRELAKLHGVIKDKVQSKLISTLVAERLDLLLEQVYNRPELFEHSTYSDQITATNYRLWQAFFSSSATKPANLVYLEQESLVNALILKHHLQQDTIIHHMLFDPDYAELIQKYFTDIMGAFSRDHKFGTYLFWGVSGDNNYRVQLWLQGRKLVSTDGTVQLELTPAAIQQALEQKQIIPNMMLIFSVLCFYYGLKCLGGFNQINYLTFMKNAYIKMCVDRGNYRSIEVCARAQTKEMNDGFTVAFLRDRYGELLPAQGLDLYLYGDAHSWNNIKKTAQQLTLYDALDPQLPELYRVVYPETERQADFTQFTVKAIATERKIDQKIVPAVTLS